MTPVLLISYEAPPRLSANAIYSAKLIRAIKAELPGEKNPPSIDLLCASPGDEVPTDEGLVDFLPDKIQVHQMEPYARGKQTILQSIIGGQGGWQRAAASKARALFPAEHKKPALIYSLSHPPASHLVAMELATDTFKGVPWIAHFTQTWSQDPAIRSHVTRNALARYESQVLRAATQLVFVSESLRDAMIPNPNDLETPEDKAVAEALRAKSRVIPYLYDLSLFTRAPLPHILQQDDPALKQVAHVGDLSSGRSVETFIAGVARLRELFPELAAKLSFWMVGPSDGQFAESANIAHVMDQMRMVPPLSYSQSLSVMESADVLLAIESPPRTQFYFPSKLIEYLGAQKPILAITPKGSLTARLMDEWDQPWCDVEDPDSIAACLRHIALGTLWPAPDPSFLEAYSAATVGKQIASTIADLIAEPQPAGYGGSDQQSHG